MMIERPLLFVMHGLRLMQVLHFYLKRDFAFSIFGLKMKKKRKVSVWFVGLVEVLGWKSNEWVANPLGPGQTSALQIKTRSV